MHYLCLNTNLKYQLLEVEKRAMSSFLFFSFTCMFWPTVEPKRSCSSLQLQAALLTVSNDDFSCFTRFAAWYLSHYVTRVIVNCTIVCTANLNVQ